MITRSFFLKVTFLAAFLLWVGFALLLLFHPNRLGALPPLSDRLSPQTAPFFLLGIGLFFLLFHLFLAIRLARREKMLSEMVALFTLGEESLLVFIFLKSLFLFA